MVVYGIYGVYIEADMLRDAGEGGPAFFGCEGNMSQPKSVIARLRDVARIGVLFDEGAARFEPHLAISSWANYKKGRNG